jgi:hypothetical protein
MGVDLYIRGVSLGKVPIARCRAFRPDVKNPVIIVEKTQGEEEIMVRRIYPLESLPLPVTTPDGTLAADEPITDERYAVDFTVRWNARLEDTRTFNAWVSRKRYETLKLKQLSKNKGKKNEDPEDRDEYLPSINLSPREWQTICGECKLLLPPFDNCSPRMFNYGALPLIRRASGELLTGPYPDRVHALTDELGKIIGFKNEDVYSKDSQAARQDIALQAWHSMVTNLGLKAEPKYIPESPPVTEADRMVDYLFFWDKTRTGWRWMGGAKVVALMAWLEKFVDIVNDTTDVIGGSAEMETFLVTMTHYYKAVWQARHYNLEIRMSW